MKQPTSLLHCYTESLLHYDGLEYSCALVDRILHNNGLAFDYPHSFDKKNKPQSMTKCRITPADNGLWKVCFTNPLDEQDFTCTTLQLKNKLKEAFAQHIGYLAYKERHKRNTIFNLLGGVTP